MQALTVDNAMKSPVSNALTLPFSRLRQLILAPGRNEDTSFYTALMAGVREILWQVSGNPGEVGG